MKLGKRLAALFAAAMMAVTGMVMTASATQFGSWGLQYYPGAPTNVNNDDDEYDIPYSGLGDFYVTCSGIVGGTVDMVLFKKNYSGNYYTCSYVNSDTITNQGTKQLGSNCESGSDYVVYAYLNHTYNTMATANGTFQS